MRQLFTTVYFLIAFCFNVQGQDRKQTFNHAYLSTSSFDTHLFPQSLKPKGVIVTNIQWDDLLGNNILILTETGRINGINGDSAALYGYHYLRNKDSIKLIRTMHDFITNCPVDVFCFFYKDALTITDLDNNGVAEITLLYALSCRGDVSPDTKKLIMFEGQNKFVIRGTSIVFAENKKTGGEKNIDNSFSSAPKIFLEFANERWNKYGVKHY